MKKTETGQDSCILELEQLPADPADTAAAAMRTRIRARFGELHAEREQLQAQLDALAAAVPQAADTSLLEELPLAGDILPALPPDLKARLFDAFDLHILWNKQAGQATIWAEITDATLKALRGTLNPGQDGYDDTSESVSEQAEVIEDLFEAPIAGTMSHRAGVPVRVGGVRVTGGIHEARGVLTSSPRPACADCGPPMSSRRSCMRP